MDRAAEDFYLFRHPLTRDAALQLMLPGDRASLHTLAADAVMSGSGAPGSAAADAAQHLLSAVQLLGGYRAAPHALSTRTASVCMAGAAWLASQSRPDDAVALYHEAAANPATGDAERFRAQLQACNALDAAGQVMALEREALAACAAAEAAGAPPIERARAMRLAGVAVLRRGEPVRAEPLLRDALAIAQREGDEELQARSLHVLASAVMARGGTAEAEALHTQALALAQRIGARELECRVLASLANVRYFSGRNADAREGYEASLAAARDVQDRRMEAAALGNLANVLPAAQHEEANALLLRAIAAARGCGDRMALATFTGNLANNRARRGRLAEAEALYHDVLGLAREVGDRRTEGLILGALGRLLSERGRQQEGEDSCRRAVAIARDLRNPRNEASALIHLADSLERVGDPGAAEVVAAALAITRSIGHRALESESLVIQARVLRRAGRTADADEADRLARELDPV